MAQGIAKSHALKVVKNLAKGATVGALGVPGAAATGATAAQMVGAAATGTQTGRNIGKWIGDNVPGAKAAADALKPWQNSLRNTLGMNQPKTASAPETKAAAATPPAAKSTTTPASAPKPAAAPASAPAKSSFYKGGSQGDYTIKRGDTLSGIAKRTGQSVSDLASMNKISDVNKISSGAKLMTKVPTPPSRPANLSTPAPASSDGVRNVKTTVSSNAGDIARQVVKTPYGSTQSVATSLATVGSKPAQASGSDITDKATYDTKTTKPAPFQSGSSSVKLSSEPEKFSGSAEGPAPLAKPSAPAPAPAAPAPEPKKKEAGAAPAAPMAESVVTVGANKYRIV